MRHFLDLPPNYGSCWFERCPPSHHEMALSPHLAQAFAQAPRPSRPTPPSTVTLAQVSLHHQRGSTMPLAAAPAAHSSSVVLQKKNCNFRDLNQGPKSHLKFSLHHLPHPSKVRKRHAKLRPDSPSCPVCVRGQGGAGPSLEMHACNEDLMGQWPRL
jgi:hypothetical protein